MRKVLLPVVGMMLWSAGMAQAGEFGVSFNDSSAQVAVGQTVSEDAKGHALLNVRGLYNDSKETKLASVGLEVLGPLGRTGLDLGAGIRGYYAKSESEKLAGAGLGGLVRFVPSGMSMVKLTGSLYYCPKIFTGMDGERLLETEISAAYEIVPRASLFLSYTVIKADIENLDERPLDDSVRGGLSLSF